VRVQVDWVPTRGETIADLAALLVALALGLGVRALSGSWALAILAIALVAYVLGRGLRSLHRKEDDHGGLARG